MSAARNLTDADVEAIAAAIARQRREPVETDSANDVPLSQAQRDAIDRKVRARMKQLRQRNGRT